MMVKYFLLTLGLALVAMLGLLLEVQSQSPATPHTNVQPSGYLIYAAGRIEGAAPETRLRPQISGRIMELMVEEGQFVGVDDVLLRVDDASYRHEVALAAAEVELAKARLSRLLNGARPQERQEAESLYRARKAELQRAQRTWDRAYHLRQERAISQQEADDQESVVRTLEAQVEASRARMELLQADARPDEVKMAQAEVAAAKARLDLAEAQWQRTQLRAPSAGQVLKINVEPGELTGPETAEPTLILADTSRWRVRAYVDELDAPRLSEGMLATITADGMPEQQLKGHVARISPRMTAKRLWTNDPAEHIDTKSREVWIDLEEAEQLVLGLRVDVRIDPESFHSTHDVPSSEAAWDEPVEQLLMDRISY